MSHRQSEVSVVTSHGWDLSWVPPGHPQFLGFQWELKQGAECPPVLAPREGLAGTLGVKNHCGQA